MDRRTVRSVVVAVLGVLAVALSAATLTTVVETGASGASGDGSVLSPPGTGPSLIELPSIPYLKEGVIVLTLLALLVTVVYLTVYQRRLLVTVVGIAVVAAVVLFLIRLLLSLFVTGTGTPVRTDVLVLERSAEGGGTGSTTPTTVFVLLVFVAVFGVVTALFGSGDGTTSPADTVEASPSEPAVVGRAAGEAADRLEADANATLGNEIYRAWHEMTELLDVPNPESTTPGEFETAAVDAGMSPPDVRELRRLFEDVRYGDHAPNDVDEQRAITVLRRIEATYAGEDP